MASLCSFPRISCTEPRRQSAVTSCPFRRCIFSNQLTPAGLAFRQSSKKDGTKKGLTVVAAVGDVSAEGTTYLVAGAVAVALVGTAFPILFSRKDLCPECDGAGFVRQSGMALRANAARKDQAQIVCARCNGLGKLNQVDK